MCSPNVHLCCKELPHVMYRYSEAYAPTCTVRMLELRNKYVSDFCHKNQKLEVQLLIIYILNSCQFICDAVVNQPA